MHSKFRSCVVLFPMAEWLRYMIIGRVDLLRGFWGGKGAVDHIFKSYYLFPFGKFSLYSYFLKLLNDH